jgi:hypothetical protein
MSLIQLIIFIILLVLVQAEKDRIATTALTGMLNYVDDVFPRTSPNFAFYQSYYDTETGQCNVLKTYKRLVGESYHKCRTLENRSTCGRVSTETYIDIYNSWGEPSSYSESDGSTGYRESGGSGLFLFITAFATVMVCSNRRPLTALELARMRYDPTFKYKYLSGKF